MQQIFLLFLKISLGTGFLGSSENLDFAPSEVGTKRIKLLNIILEPIKRGLNPKDDPFNLKIKRVTEIFVGQAKTK